MQPKRCNVTQVIYFCEMLYMFQVVPPPIIRSSNCVYRIGYFYHTFTATCYCRGRVPALTTTETGSSKLLTKYPMLYRKFWASDDGRRNRLKHVEHFTEINKLCNVASCWLYLKIILRCSDPWTSNLRNLPLYQNFKQLLGPTQPYVKWLPDVLSTDGAWGWPVTSILRWV